MKAIWCSALFSLLACGGEDADPDGAHRADPPEQQAQALGAQAQFHCVEVTNDACTGAATSAPMTIDGTSTSFSWLSHLEGNITFNGNPVPDNVTIDDSPASRSISVTATRCHDHVKACYGSTPWSAFNRGVATQAFVYQFGASAPPNPNVVTQPAVAGDVSTLAFIDRVNAAFPSANDEISLYSPGGAGVLVDGMRLSSTMTANGPWPGNAGRMQFLSWAGVNGGGSDPCAVPIGSPTWVAHGCWRLHTGVDTFALRMFAVNAGSRFSILDPRSAPITNEVCTLVAISGPFLSSGSYVDLSLQPTSAGLAWEASVGDTLEGTPGHTTSVPAGSPLCYSYSLTPN